MTKTPIKPQGKLLATTPKPPDYPMVVNVTKDGEEKPMHHFVIKFWWVKSTNGKDSYVLNGQQLFDTYLATGKKFENVIKAMVAKFNDNLVNCKKIVIYDNSNYGNIIKLVEYNGQNTSIHDHINNKIIYTTNGQNINFVLSNNNNPKP